MKKRFVFKILLGACLALALNGMLCAARLPGTTALAAGNIVIDGVDIGYAPSDHFTQDGLSCWRSPGVRCHKHKPDICTYPTGSCNCRRFVEYNGDTIDLGGSQCYGFAEYVLLMLYGSTDNGADPVYSCPSDYNTLISAHSGSVDADWVKKNFMELPAGSHIRMGTSPNGNQHSQIVVSTSEDGITIAECNTDGGCKITLKTYTWQEEANTINGHNAYIQYVKAHHSAQYTPDRTPPVISRVYTQGVSADGFRVVADIADISDMDTVVFYVWHDGMTSQYTYEGVFNGDYSWFMDIDFSDFGNPTNTTFYIEAYAYDWVGNLSRKSAPNLVIGSASQPVPTPPALSIDSVYYQGVSSSSFRVVADITKNTDLVENVIFYIRHEGMDDWISYEGVFNGGHSWFMDVSLSDFGNVTTATYITHVYAYDASGNAYGVVAPELYIEGSLVPSTHPISSVYYQGVTTEGFRVVADVPTQADRIDTVVFYVKYEGMDEWFDYEGVFNGDHSWFMDISLSDFNGATNVTYITHAYAYDAAGNSYGSEAPDLYIDATPPVISDVKISRMSPTGYRISAKVADRSDITKVTFPTWLTTTTSPSADHWFAGKTDGNGVWYVDIDIADFDNAVNCKYRTHIYAYDSWGNSSRAIVGDTYMDGSAPEILSFSADPVCSLSTTFRVTASDNVAVDHVRISIQDAQAASPILHWIDASLQNGQYVAAVNLMDLKLANAQTCSYQIYAYDAAGHYAVSPVQTLNVLTDVPALSFRLPASLRQVSTQAFQSDARITGVYIPDGQSVVIDSQAFASCSALKKIVLFDNVIEIESDAFDACTQVQFYCPYASYAMYYAIEQQIPYYLIAQ